MALKSRPTTPHHHHFPPLSHSHPQRSTAAHSAGDRRAGWAVVAAVLLEAGKWYLNGDWADNNLNAASGRVVARGASGERQFDSVLARLLIINRLRAG